MIGLKYLNVALVIGISRNVVPSVVVFPQFYGPLFGPTPECTKRLRIAILIPLYVLTRTRHFEYESSKCSKPHSIVPQSETHLECIAKKKREIAEKSHYSYSFLG